MGYYNKEQKREVASKIKALLKKYGMKGSLAVRHNRTVELNLKEGIFNFRVNNYGGNLNLYFIDEYFTGLARKFVTEAYEILLEHNHNRADIMTNRFAAGRYIWITVGQGDRPYKLADQSILFTLSVNKQQE